MQPIRALIDAIDAMDTALAEDDNAELDVEALTLACQNLVSWAMRFDPKVMGTEALTPSDEEQAAVLEVASALRKGEALLTTHKDALNERIQGARRSRRGLGGYAFLKPVGVERQFVSFKA